MITLLADNSFQTNDYANMYTKTTKITWTVFSRSYYAKLVERSTSNAPSTRHPSTPRSLPPLTNLSSLSVATLIGTDTSEGFRTRSVTSVTVFLLQWLMARDFLFRTVEATDFLGGLTNVGTRRLMYPRVLSLYKA